MKFNNTLIKSKCHISLGRAKYLGAGFELNKCQYCHMVDLVNHKLQKLTT